MPSLDEETIAKPSAAEPSYPSRKIKRVEWMELEPIDPPADMDFDFEHIDTLWYRNLDYGAFLHQQIMASHDLKRCEAFVGEYGPARLVKAIAVQVARLASTLLSTVPTLVQMMKDHAESNPAEIERLRNMLGEKEVAFIEQVEEVNRWVRKEAETQAKL